MHSRNTTILLSFNIVHYTLAWCFFYYCPYSNWKFLYTSFWTFCKYIIILTGEPIIHSASKGSNNTAWPSYVRKWSTHYASLSAMFKPITPAVQIKNLWKAFLFKVATMKNTMVPHAPVISNSYCLEVKYRSIHYVSLPAMFNPLHSKNTSVIKVVICYEKYGQFPLCKARRKPSHGTTKSTYFAVNKRWMGYKGWYW